MKLRIIPIIIVIAFCFFITYPISWAETFFDLDLRWVSYLLVLFTLFAIWLIVNLPNKNESSITWPLKSRRNKLVVFIGIIIEIAFTIFPRLANIDNYFWWFLFPAIGWGLMVLFIQIFGSVELKNWLFQRESDK